MKSKERDNAAILLEMKEKLQNVSGEIKTKKGRQEIFYEQLKKEFECKTLDEADIKLADIDKRLADMTKKRDKGVESLLKKYDWNFNQN